MSEIDDLDLDLLDSSKSEVTGKRPVFITVLCILTWVGSAAILFYAMVMLIMFGSFEKLFTGNNALGDIPNQLIEYYRWWKITLYLTIFGSLLCVAGSVLMWTLRKIGYYIYILGQILPFVGSTMMILSITKGEINGGSIVFQLIFMIIPIGFIVMYGTNLKHMTK